MEKCRIFSLSENKLFYKITYRRKAKNRPITKSTRIIIFHVVLLGSNILGVSFILDITTVEQIKAKFTIWKYIGNMVSENMEKTKEYNKIAIAKTAGDCFRLLPKIRNSTQNI